MAWNFCSGHFPNLHMQEYKIWVSGVDIFMLNCHLLLQKMSVTVRNMLCPCEYLKILIPKRLNRSLFLKNRFMFETCLLLILWNCENSPCLVEGSSTVLCSTQAGDLLILNREFVIISDLFIYTNRLPRVDDYLLLSFYSDNFGIAVWLWKEKHTNKTINHKMLKTEMN